MADNLAVHIARLAVVDHFDQAYGRNVTKIAAWQQLCRDVGAEVGPSITQCKKVFAALVTTLNPPLTSLESERHLCQHRGLCEC